MWSPKRFVPGIEGLEARVVLSHPSIQQLVTDVRRVAETLKSDLPLTSLTLLQALEKKPADLTIQPAGPVKPLYDEIANSTSLQRFAGNLFGSAPEGSTTGSSPPLTLDSSTDLNAAINTVANLSYQVQKGADGSGSINLALNDTYHPAWATFESLALSYDHSAKLAKAIGSIGQHWSRIIHPYTISVSITYNYPPSSGSQPPPSSFPLGTYSGSFSATVDVQNTDTGAESSINSAGTITVSIQSYDSLDGLTSASITITNLAGQTLSAPIEGTIAEGRDIYVLAFTLGYEGNSGNLGVSIAGTFQGTTMIVTTFDFFTQQGPIDYSAGNVNQNGLFDLALV